MLGAPKEIDLGRGAGCQKKDSGNGEQGRALTGLGRLHLDHLDTRHLGVLDDDVDGERARWSLIVRGLTALQALDLVPRVAGSEPSPVIDVVVGRHHSALEGNALDLRRVHRLIEHADAFPSQFDASSACNPR